MKRIIDWFKAVYGIVGKLEAIRVNALDVKTDIYASIRKLDLDIADVIRTFNEALDVNDEADAEMFAKVLDKISSLSKNIRELDGDLSAGLEMMAEVASPPMFYIGQMVCGKLVVSRDINFEHDKFNNCCAVYYYKLDGDDNEYTESELHKMFNNK